LCSCSAADETADEARLQQDPDILPQELLRKYITYAKQTCQPKLQMADYDKVAAVREANTMFETPCGVLFVARAGPKLCVCEELVAWGRLQQMGWRMH
jgi:DNA replicative helicase MCM subunit Mcm2 (Cdc46/Mcm family)